MLGEQGCGGHASVAGVRPIFNVFETSGLPPCGRFMQQPSEETFHG